jgi:hypothetical protein
MRMRKSCKGASSTEEPLASSELASGSSITSSLGTSDEYTTGIEYSRTEAGEGADGSSPASASAEEGSDDGGVGGDDRSERERTVRRR